MRARSPEADGAARSRPPRRSSAAASAAGVVGRHEQARLRRATTAVAMAATSLATTGRPLAIASSTTLGRPSRSSRPVDARRDDDDVGRGVERRQLVVGEPAHEARPDRPGRGRSTSSPSAAALRAVADDVEAPRRRPFGPGRASSTSKPFFSTSRPTASRRIATGALGGAAWSEAVEVDAVADEASARRRAAPQRRGDVGVARHDGRRAARPGGQLDRRRPCGRRGRGR